MGLNMKCLTVCCLLLDLDKYMELILISMGNNEGIGLGKALGALDGLLLGKYYGIEIGSS